MIKIESLFERIRKLQYKEKVIQIRRKRKAGNEVDCCKKAITVLAVMAFYIEKQGFLLKWFESKRKSLPCHGTKKETE